MRARSDRDRRYHGRPDYPQRRFYNPDEDMGGSHWSGASGRGGMHWRDMPGGYEGFAGSDFGPEPDRFRSVGIVRDYDPEEGERDFGGPEYGGPARRGYEPSGPTRQERGPYYGKGPKGYKRSDDRIREDVCEAIASQGMIDASDVEVKVEAGVVILSGTVAARHHKRGLEQIVERTRGVEDVHNELRLSRPEEPNRRESPRESGTMPRTANDGKNTQS
ncbi:MAG: BON domain-containing protein [Labilithrix sp.]|nr:BON domain-containing protein [Labilithrix sp.]